MSMNMLATLRFSQRVPRKIEQDPVGTRAQLTQRSRAGQALDFAANASARLTVQTMGWKATAGSP